MHFYRSALLFQIFILSLYFPAFSQPDNSTVLTAADYQRAERFMGYNVNQLVDRLHVRANWLPNERFWYRILTAQGSEFVLVDPARGTRLAAFDQQKLAAALSTAAGKKYEASHLPFASFKYSADGNSISFTAAYKNWKCNIQAYGCAVDETADTGTGNRRSLANSVLSPDGKRAAFIRDFNLWVREVFTNKETQLTTDGIKDFGYATDNAGWKKSDQPIIAWSPDSKKIATYQQDQRNASDMYLVTTNVGKPTLQAWKYPLPGDKEIITIHRVIIEVDNPKVVRLKLPPDPHRGTLCDDISCSGTDFGDV
ncbi:MAG TPA: DPP IV N-terminal domain-containing protein, partial [Segetibacter sp.]